MENNEVQNGPVTTDSVEELSEIQDERPPTTPVDIWQQRAMDLESHVNGVDERVNAEKDKALRAMAELENFKRRKEQEVSQFKQYAKEQTILEILPVLDSFDRACEHSIAKGESTDDGFLLIHKQFHSILEKWGVIEIPSVGQAFDPHVHQAVLEQEEADTAAGLVLKELQKGYKLSDKVIRPAMVIVSK